MSHLFCSQSCARWGVFGFGRTVSAYVLREGGRRVLRRKQVQGVAIPAVDVSELGIADADRVFSIAWNTGCRSPGELLMT